MTNSRWRGDRGLALSSSDPPVNLDQARSLVASVVNRTNGSAPRISPFICASNAGGYGFSRGVMRAVQRPLDEKLADPFGDQSGLFLAIDLVRQSLGLLPLPRARSFAFERRHRAIAA